MDSARDCCGRATRGLICFLTWIMVGGCSHAQPAPDIRSIPADLQIPKLSDGPPAAGKRVKLYADPARPELYHVLYLPRNYSAQQRLPLIVEFAGNGGYENKWGDRSHGVPEGSQLGYGISGGQDFAWLCLPFVTENGSEVAKQWWGSPPDFSPQQTVNYAKATVESVLHEFQLDEQAVLLCGFSRGAIACNFIGLHDDEIAQLWCGMVAYSHYDGVRDWGLPGTDANAAQRRLERLGNTPQFICHEHTSAKGLSATRDFIANHAPAGDFTFLSTGFRNHNDGWVLRESPARRQLRDWVYSLPPVQRSLQDIR